MSDAVSRAAALMSVPRPVACGSSHSRVSRRQPEPVPTSRMRNGPRHPAFLARDLQRCGNHGFAIGPRIEGRGGDGEGPAIEVPLAEDARYGLVLPAALDEGPQKLKLGGGQHPLRRPATTAAPETPRAAAASRRTSPPAPSMPARASWAVSSRNADPTVGEGPDGRHQALASSFIAASWLAWSSATSASINSSSAVPSSTSSSLCRVRPMRWSVTRPCGKL